MEKIQRYLDFVLWFVFTLVVFRIVYAFAFPKYAPIQDNWSHCFTLFCLRNYSEWHNLLEINYLPYAGWITPFTLYPFVLLWGYVGGSKLYIISLVFFLFFAYGKYIYSYTGEKNLILWILSTIISLNLFLIKGFFSFIIGLIVFLLILAITNNKTGKERVKWFIALVLIEIFIHPFFVAEALLLVFWDVYSRKLYGKLPLKMIFFVSIILFGLIYGFKRVAGVAWTVSILERMRLVLTGGYIFPWYYSSKIPVLLFLSYIQPFVVGIPLLSLTFFIKSKWYVSNSSINRNVIALTAVTNFLLYVVIFDVFKTGSYIHTRQIFMGFILIIPFVLREIEDRCGQYCNFGLKVYLITTLMFEVMIINEKFKIYSDRFVHIVKMLDNKFESQVRFIGIVYHDSSGGYAYPLRHIGGLVAILNGSFYLNNLDFLNSYRPLKLKLPVKIKKLLRSPESCDSLYTYASQYFKYVFIVGATKKGRDYERCTNSRFFDVVYRNDELILLKRKNKNVWLNDYERERK